MNGSVFSYGARDRRRHPASCSIAAVVFFLIVKPMSVMAERRKRGQVAGGGRAANGGGAARRDPRPARRPAVAGLAADLLGEVVLLAEVGEEGRAGSRASRRAPPRPRGCPRGARGCRCRRRRPPAAMPALRRGIASRLEREVEAQLLGGRLADPQRGRGAGGSGCPRGTGSARSACPRASSRRWTRRWVCSARWA